MLDAISELLSPLNPSDATSTKVSQIALEAIEAEALRTAEEFLTLCGYCQSPIERLLLAALFAKRGVCEFDLQFRGGGTPSARGCVDETVYVYQQGRVGNYATDFLLLDVSVPAELVQPRWMVVECDGHDFHEKTKEQARHDKKRDRFMQSRGIKVLRFTGSEVFADPDAVAEEVIGELQLYDEWRHR